MRGYSPRNTGLSAIVSGFLLGLHKITFSFLLSNEIYSYSQLYFPIALMNANPSLSALVI